MYKPSLVCLFLLIVVINVIRLNCSRCHDLARTNNTHELQQLLLAMPEDLRKEALSDQAFKNKMSPMHVAAFYGSYDAAAVLADLGAPLELRDDWGNTPLRSAVRQNQIAIVQLLCTRGVYAGAVDSQDNTPLHCAAEHDFIECAQILVAHDAPFTDANSSGRTPFHTAARYNAHRVLAFLCQKYKELVDESMLFRVCLTGQRSPLNQKTEGTGWTALHFAAMNNHPLCVSILLDAGADLKSQDINLNTPLHLALIHKAFQAVGILRVHGAPVDVLNKFSQTPRSLARKYSTSLFGGVIG